MRLILVFGLPGSGKTTFADALAVARGSSHYNSDIMRAQLGLRGQYDRESKSSVYKRLLERVEQHLQEGKEVIVDATFYLEALREPFVKLAQKTGAAIFWIEVRARPEVIRKRVRKKRVFSEADFSVYEKVKNAFEPLEDAHLTLDSDVLSLEEMVRLTLLNLSSNEKETPG